MKGKFDVLFTVMFWENVYIVTLRYVKKNMAALAKAHLQGSTAILPVNLWLRPYRPFRIKVFFLVFPPNNFRIKFSILDHCGACLEAERMCGEQTIYSVAFLLYIDFWGARHLASAQ